MVPGGAGLGHVKVHAQVTPALSVAGKCTGADLNSTSAAIQVTVCRQGLLKHVQLQLETESALGTTHLLHFAGAQFQVKGCPPPPPPPPRF